MKHRSELSPFYPLLLYIAEVAFVLPVSNAWPERGFSLMKLVKTRLRSSLSSEMLNYLLLVLMNGPSVKDSHKFIEECVRNWLEAKPRRKLPKRAPEAKKSSSVVVDMSTQTDEMAEDVTVEEVLQEVNEIGNVLDLDPCNEEDKIMDSDYDSAFEEDF